MDEKQRTLQTGEVLNGRYRIISRKRDQDIGTLYAACNTQRAKPVVVLVLAGRLRGDTAAMERLTKLQRALADLGRPTLIPIEYIGMVHGQPYLVYSHAPGRTLADLLHHVETLETDAAVRILTQVSEALEPAHRVGLVHGGLSTECVLLGEDGQIMVMDTGLLPALRPALVPPGQPWGRSPYLSPEQAAGEDVHPTSDVYVLGLMLYEMLAGRPAFDAASEAQLVVQHLRQTPPHLQTLVPNIPPRLAQIANKALAKEPAARFRNAGQVARILQLPLVLQATPQKPAPSQHTPASGRLVVPPPPAYPARQDDYYGRGSNLRAGESPGATWLMIALIIATLIAVLGLVLLWRAVYRRYSGPPQTAAAFSYHLDEPAVSCIEPPSRGPEKRGQQSTTPKRARGEWESVDRYTKASRATPMPYRPLEAKKPRVWESSLRLWSHAVVHCRSNRFGG